MEEMERMESLAVTPSWWRDKHKPREPRRSERPCPGRSHTVRAGETMWKIAKHYGVCLQQMIEANPHIPGPDELVPGDVLCIPQPKEEPGEREEWCCVVLEPRHEDVPDPSVALVRLGRRGHVMIALHDMPDPATIDRRRRWDSNEETFEHMRTQYVGWLFSESGRIKARIRLHRAGDGLWIGHGDADVAASDDILVTAEVSAGVPEPSPLIVYRATLEECAEND